jgi:ribosomal protein L10
MVEKKKSDKRIRKENYRKKLWALTDEYKKAVLVDVDNVSSKQITKIRHRLRAINAVMIMGKNVLFFVIFNIYLDFDEVCS